MGLFRGAWRTYFPKPDEALLAPIHETFVEASPSDQLAAAQQLAQYFLDKKFKGDALFNAMVDAEANTGIPVSAIDRAYDVLKYEQENPVSERKIDPKQVGVLDLTSIPTVRTRIKGVSYYVSDVERERYGDTKYMLVLEPENKFDNQAIAVYGWGRKVGHLSAARAAAMTELLRGLPFDGYMVSGTATTVQSSVFWVDVPKSAELRKFLKDLNPDSY